MNTPTTLGCAFDTGRIRRAEFDLFQLRETAHDLHLEQDYQIMREEMGMSVFRDGIDIEAMGRGDWSYLDRLANLARNQVWLSIFHYDWPAYTTIDRLESGRAAEAAERFAYDIARRYRGVFPVYFPTVEIGYWAAMIGTHHEWWPATEGSQGDWWTFYPHLALMTIATARGIKAGDPQAKIAMSEPWLRCEVPVADLARPFRTVAGMTDPISNRQLGYPLVGSPDLLDFAGLNCYGHPEAGLLREAASLLPGLRLILAETGNCHHPEIPRREWMERTLLAVKESAAPIEAIFWAPAVTIGDFGTRAPVPGALLSRSRQLVATKWSTAFSPYLAR